MFKHPKTQATFIHSFIIHFSSLSASFKEESQSMSFSTFLLVLERAEVVATSLIFASLSVNLTCCDMATSVFTAALYGACDTVQCVCVCVPRRGGLNRDSCP